VARLLRARLSPGIVPNRARVAPPVASDASRRAIQGTRRATGRTDGWGDGSPLVRQIPEMMLVSVLEELLIRGVIFRIAEQAWGSRRALVGSTVLFVVAHLPGEISLMGVLVTATASLAFTAAYQLSRRLWLPMGMHFAWNYLFSAVFSVPVSGHEAEGWLHGSMSGPEWLSGGVYGVEASAVALLVWTVAAALLLRRADARSVHAAPSGAHPGRPR